MKKKIEVKKFKNIKKSKNIKKKIYKKKKNKRKNVTKNILLLCIIFGLIVICVSEFLFFKFGIKNNKKIINDKYVEWEKNEYGDNYVFGVGPELVYETQSYGLTTNGVWFNPYEVSGGLLVRYANGDDKMLFESKGAKKGVEVHENKICIFNALVIDKNNINNSSNYIPTFTLGKSKDGNGNFMSTSTNYNMQGAIKWFPFSDSIVDMFDDDAYNTLNERIFSASWKFDYCDKYADYIYEYSVSGDEIKEKCNKYIEWFKNIESIEFVYEKNIPTKYDYIGTIPYSNGLICVQDGKALTIFARDTSKKIYLSKDTSNLFSCISQNGKYYLDNCTIDMKNVDCSLTENWDEIFYSDRISFKNFDRTIIDKNTININKVIELFEDFIKQYNIIISDNELEVINMFLEYNKEHLTSIKFTDLKALYDYIRHYKNEKESFDNHDDNKSEDSETVLETERYMMACDFNIPCDAAIVGEKPSTVKFTVEKGKAFEIPSIDSLKNKLEFEINEYEFCGWNLSGSMEEIMIGMEKRNIECKLYASDGEMVSSEELNLDRIVEVKVPVYKNFLKVEFDDGYKCLPNEDRVYKAVWKPKVYLAIDSNTADNNYIETKTLGEVYKFPNIEREHSRLAGFEDMDGNFYNQDAEVLLYERINEEGTSKVTFRAIWEREYIVDVKIADGRKDNSPAESLKKSGYKVINQDLNKDARWGDIFGKTRVYMGYKTAWLEEGKEVIGIDRLGRKTDKAITSLYVHKTYEDIKETSWRGMNAVTLLDDDCVADMDIGEKQYAILYCERNSREHGLIDIIPHEFNEGGHGKWIKNPVNVFCEYKPDFYYLDVNRDTGGKFIYLEQVY